MCVISRVEVIGHDNLETIRDEISPWFALVVICRCFLAYGGKITSVTDTTMVVEVFWNQPEKMTLTGDSETMAFLRRAAEAIKGQENKGNAAKPAPAEDVDGLTFALQGLAQAHSGEDRAFTFLLAGAGIVKHEEIQAMKSLPLRDALTVYELREATAGEGKWTLRELVHVVKEFSSFLRSCQTPKLGKTLLEVQNYVEFAFKNHLKVMDFLVEGLETLARGGSVEDITRAYLPQAA